ncbi:hypothetical protein GCM10007079_15910 [Nocardiopsis terrae]|uniref:Uncharacterized protein n=1 Tax=Nocardiopsis terrae TaxID=372655 RepID=A0ABR9HBB1_9ACTN|nr:hypothetical protein [Nocardiopsis terrae]MBE1456206.1 hypothetical protein [Nocardiopsis terrae]GHC78192.1 hypothetical protein GCM10007079_15910 [Nocardiopsis terrae]
MGDPRGQLPQERETRVETHTEEIRLDDESPRTRADVDFDRTPVSYGMEAGIGTEGAWGRFHGRARAGSTAERASASLLTLTGTVLPPLALGGLAHVAGAPAVVTLALAGAVWTLATLVAAHITRTR